MAHRVALTLTLSVLLAAPSPVLAGGDADREDGLKGKQRRHSQKSSDGLTTLDGRPLGVQTVTNPLPATGGAEEESRDEARRNAPTVASVLDRCVSRADKEEAAKRGVACRTDPATSP